MTFLQDSTSASASALPSTPFRKAMSDLKLSFDHVTELTVPSMALEKSLQSLIEKHLDTFLGIAFLASEYSTGPKTGGRMDT